MNNNKVEELLSVNKVMEHFGISRSTLYHLTKTELPYVKIRNLTANLGVLSGTPFFVYYITGNQVNNALFTA